MVASIQTVLLCAEDDDLDLVRVVHHARQGGLELEVVPGVDTEEQPLLDAIERAGPSLFVLLRSDNLSSDRVLALKRVFEQRKAPAQYLLALRLDPGRAEHAVEAIRKRIAQLGYDEDATISARHPTPPIDAPQREASTATARPPGLRSTELEVTERHAVVAHDSVETETIRGPSRKTAAASVRRHRALTPLRVVLGTAVMAALGAGGYLAYGRLTAPTPDHAAPVVVEPQVLVPAEAVAPDGEFSQRETAERNRRNLHRRATPRRP